MLGHLGINVVELRAAKTYYDALLPLLGFTEFVSADDEFAYRPRGRKAWHLPVLLSVHRTGLQHLAFMVTRRRITRRSGSPHGATSSRSATATGIDRNRLR
jgi:hypothetical protein